MDFLPTKGIEYLFAISYLALLTATWFALRHSVFKRTPVGAIGPGGPLARLSAWFKVPEGVYFHRGHTWAVQESDDVFRVGIDDFARQLVGLPDELALPKAGEQVEQGEPGMRVSLSGRSVSLLSPVSGEVVDVNSEVASAPTLLSDDPYGDGWLMKVRVPKVKATIRNLLSGQLAKDWMADTAKNLGALFAQGHGALQQDGGLPITGFGRHLDDEQWQQIVTELLLTGDSD